MIQTTNIYEEQLSVGDFADEELSAADFDRRMERLDMFKVHREVWGYPLQPRIGANIQMLRIDRILVPKLSTTEKGWNIGAVGVELKRSGEKIGPAIAQGIDYQRVGWELVDTGIVVMTPWVFLWPFESQHGAVASILAQQRIGTCAFSDYREFFMNAGGTSVLSMNNGLKEIKPCKCGTKTGSR